MVAGCMESSFFGRLASAPAAELKVRNELLICFAASVIPNP